MPSERSRTAAVMQRNYGFYFVKVDFRFAAAAATAFTLQPITYLGMQPMPDSNHDSLRNYFFH